MAYHSNGPGWLLLHGDFRDTCAHAQGLVDLVACSPPYCDARTYGRDTSWTDADYARLGDAVWLALKPGGHARINVDAPVRAWRPGVGTERGFHPWRMMLDWGERIGFRVPDRLFFGRQGNVGEYKGRFRNDVEPLLWFQKPGTLGFFDKMPLTETAAYQRNVGVASQAGREANGEIQRIRGYSGDAANNQTKRRGTLWNYGAQGKGHTGAPDIEAADHPARWPFRLAADIVRCFCPPGGLVLDPFVGAGTTVAAALAHGRTAIGGDFDMQWLDKAAGILRARQGA